MRLIYSFAIAAFFTQFTLGTSAFAVQKSIQEYWKDVGLKFPIARQLLSNSNCYQSEANFNGCFEAMNAALRASRGNLKLVASDCPTLLKGSSSAHVARANFGSAQIVSSAASNQHTDEDSDQASQQSLSEASKKIRADQAQHDRELKRLFSLRTGTSKLDFEAVNAWILQNIISQAKAEESYITSEALNAFYGASKDPHTYILPEAYFEAHNSQTTEVFYGIGAGLSLVGKKLFVVKPFDGSPALASGLRAKDQILEIDGKKINGENSKENLNLIKGPKGTPVTLKIKRGGAVIDIRIVRGEIVQNNVSYSILKDAGTNLGYISLKSFIEKSCSDIRNAIKQLSKQKVTGFVLDLRDDGGGLIEEAVCIVGLFMGPGKTVVIEKYLDTSIPDEVQKTSGRQMTTLPLITLINAGSASASEVVSGALQDHQRSIILGERSFGKATVQAVAPIARPKGVVMAQTVARFFQPSGRTNQVVGILPDVEVFSVPHPTEDDKVAFREEDSYSNALPKIGAPWVQPRPDYVQELLKCMQQSGNAEKLFQMRQNDAIPPDFQLLTSQDVLLCMQSR